MLLGAPKSIRQFYLSSLGMILGAFLAAFALEVFLLPNNIIDGGVIGLAILLTESLDIQSWLYPLVLIFNLPFVFLGYRSIAKTFVLQMLISVIAFTAFGHVIAHSPWPVFSHYRGELLEIVVIGGGILGLGVGLIIRCGGCLDGTEILGVLINRNYSFSVGSVILSINIVIFAIAGLVFNNWHSSIQSFITFFVAIKIMDIVIVGLDEMKSLMIFSDKNEEIAKELMHQMGLGLTFLNGRGGFTGEKKDVIFLIAERLQLAGIKNLVHAKDPSAFIAIENLHEVAAQNSKAVAKKPYKL